MVIALSGVCNHTSDNNIGRPRSPICLSSETTRFFVYFSRQVYGLRVLNPVYLGRIQTYRVIFLNQTQE